MQDNVLLDGFDMPTSQVARLALCLRRAGNTGLANDLGFAIDANRAEVRLAPADAAAIVNELGNDTASLALRRHLLQRHDAALQDPRERRLKRRRAACRSARSPRNT